MGGAADLDLKCAIVSVLLFAAGCWCQCRLPEHPSNGKHSPVETYCPPHEWHEPRCQSVPGITVPDGWLLSVKCDDGFVLNTLETSQSQSTCADGRWLPPLAACSYSYTNDKHKCVAPPYPKNGKYDPLPIECAVNDKNTEELILPGTFVPSMCVLLYSCNEGYELSETDVISICEAGEWIPNRVTCKQKSTFATKTRPNKNGCVLPVQRENRNYCTFQCSDCARGSCSFAPGSTVTDNAIKVQCDPGYRSSDNQEYSTMVCIDGSWVQEFPQCLRLCPPLTSESLIVRCFYGSSQVDCSRAMLPETSATYQCKSSYREYLGLAKANVYSRTIYCKNDGFWTYQLPECEPVCGVSLEGTVTPTVVDGKVTELGAFPWHAGLYRREDSNWNCFCGGSLVTNRIVLTAAHCVFKMKEADVRIGLGKKFRTWSRNEPTAVKRAVARIEVPKEYRGSTATYTWDIALILLREKVEFNSFVLPVCRDTNLEFDINKDNTGYVVGWGRTMADGRESEVLLHNDLTIKSNVYCSQKMPSFLSFDKLCGIKPSNGVSIVEKGDSGGGLTAVFNNLHYIFGIVSVKFNNLSVFTDVSWDTHKRWIDEEIGRLSTFVN